MTKLNSLMQKMDNNSPGNYLIKYKNGKFLELKISGESFDSDEFQDFINYVKELHLQGIPIILVYGGGSQISEIYLQNTGKLRTKGKDGQNITDKNILVNGVIPAYDKLEKKLIEALGKDSLNIFTPDDILAKKVKGLGQVGMPKKILKSFSKKKINIIPFVSTDIESGELLNTNADDLVQVISASITTKINNIIFLTGTGGLLDNKKNIVPSLSLIQLEDIINGKHKLISVDGGMLKKLQTIHNKLSLGISKITVTSLGGLKEEIETKNGSGTLFKR